MKRFLFVLLPLSLFLVFLVACGEKKEATQKKEGTSVVKAEKGVKGHSIELSPVQKRVEKEPTVVASPKTTEIKLSDAELRASAMASPLTPIEVLAVTGPKDITQRGKKPEGRKY